MQAIPLDMCSGLRFGYGKIAFCDAQLFNILCLPVLPVLSHTPTQLSMKLVVVLDFATQQP